MAQREDLNDPRIMQYITAARAGDRVTMDGLRTVDNPEDPVLRRFDAIDGVLSKTIEWYEAEIRLLRAELEAWKDLGDQFEAMSQSKPSSRKHEKAEERAGQIMTRIEELAVIRKTMPEVDVPAGDFLC